MKKSQKISQGLQKAHNFINKKPVKFFVVFLVIIFIIYFLYEQGNEILAVSKNLHVRFKPLICSFLFIMLASGSGGIAWVLFMLSYSTKIETYSLVKIHVLSSLVKYIPGGIWDIVSKISLTQIKNNDRKGVWIIIYNTLITILIGLGINLLLVLKVRNFPINHDQLIILPLVGGLVLFIVIFSPILLIRLCVNPDSSEKNKLNIGLIYIGIIIISFSWLFLNLGNLYLVESLNIFSLDFFSSFFIVTGSFISGLLVFFIPNGYVVREYVSTVLSTGLIEQNLSIIISVFLRLEILLSEIFFLLIVIIFDTTRKIINKRTERKYNSYG